MKKKDVTVVPVLTPISNVIPVNVLSSNMNNIDGKTVLQLNLSAVLLHGLHLKRRNISKI